MDSKKVYPYSFEVARQNGEDDQYRESLRLNGECINAIDEAILACNYEMYRYKFFDAFKSVVDRYGFERLNWVLAGVIQKHKYDGRYSRDNKEWASEVPVPRESTADFVFQTHPIVIDGFVDRVRKEHIVAMAQEVGQYEKSRHLAERNRLTWYHGDFGVFAPKAGVTAKQLTDRHCEIMEKLEQRRHRRGAAAVSDEMPSVLNKISMAREVSQPPSTLKEKKKTQGQEH